MRRFHVVSTVMGNDEKCLLLRVGFRFSAVDLPAQKFCAGPKRKVANAIQVKSRGERWTDGRTKNEARTYRT